MLSGTFVDGMDGLMAWDAPTPFAICSPAYRLALEYPHPVPVQDCLAVLRWLVSYADELGIDPARVIVMGGRARAGSLQGLPRTFMECGSADLFRSEVLAFAEHAWLDGVDCELHVWPGGLHGHFIFAPDASIALRTLATRREWLDRALQ